MKFLRVIASELVGLFVDDGSLALWSLMLIAVVSAAILLMAFPALWGAGLLLAGCMAILAWSVLRAARRS